jgi:hypothetical protein
MKYYRLLSVSLILATSITSTVSAHTSVIISSQDSHYNNNRLSSRYSVVPQFSTRTYGPVISFGNSNYRRNTNSNYNNRNNN